MTDPVTDPVSRPALQLDAGGTPRAGGALARINERARDLLRDLSPQTLARRAIDATPASLVGTRLARVSPFWASFVVMVVAPAAAIIFYLAFLASDQYVAETKFALRTAEIEFAKDKTSSASSTQAGVQSNSSAAASLGLPSLSGQDAYVVAAYVRSPAIFPALAETIDVREVYRRPEADFWAKLPAQASLERLTAYWRTMATVSVESLSGIVTVTVRAFRRDDALALAEAITRASERLVNDLSARARADATRHAEEEVRRAESQMQKALTDMRNFRDSKGLISPETAAGSASTLLLAAMGDRIRLQSEISAASRIMSPQAPTLASLRSRLDAADAQIAQLKSQLTGESAKTISSSISRYEELELQRQFAEKVYMMSQEALERARLRAGRQSVYLTAFAPAFPPQEAMYPKRVHYALLLPLALLIVWGIVAMVAATIQDHRV